MPFMKIISANLNGIRSAAKKDFFAWMLKQEADYICVQELKAQEADMTADFLQPLGYHGYFHYAEKKGYSGTGVYSRTPALRHQLGFGNAEFDAEGRYVQCDYADLSVVSVYCPSGSASDERQQAKFRFMDAFMPHLLSLRKSGREVVICGDWNIAHKEIDLKNWKSNHKNSGFLPEERQWMSDVLDKADWRDVYRLLHPDTTGEAYTWWSNRGQAWANNVGWRIDYQVATPGIAATSTSASVYKDERFSDHSPLIINYDWPASFLAEKPITNSNRRQHSRKVSE
jgi:exodeoxyribonuclease-3